VSAQVDRFVHDRLPPAEQLPVFRYDLPELQLPDQLNLVEELLDKAVAKGLGDKPMLRSPQGTLTYAQAALEVNRIAQVLFPISDVRAKAEVNDLQSRVGLLACPVGH